MKDLNLFYSGGAGGFLLLHLLLLSGKYHVIFGNHVPIDIEMAIDQQWKIFDHTKWKTREVWPNNEKTFHSDSKLTKIYYYCNPWEKYHQIKNYSSYNVGLYTDFYSQFKMACFKNANWFSVQGDKLEGVNFRAHIWAEHYNKIKGSGWPDCPGVIQINSLPVEIQNEIFDNPLTQSTLNVVLSAKTESYQNQQISGEILPFLKTADAVVKLQDLTNEPARILKQVFNIKSLNSKQIDLLEHWKTLHPPQLLTSIGISTTRS